MLKANYSRNYICLLIAFCQSAGYLLDMSVHTSEGFVTAGHKLVFLANFKILQQFQETDCLILPDFSPDSVKNLLEVMYDPSHRLYLCVWCKLNYKL